MFSVSAVNCPKCKKLVTPEFMFKIPPVPSASPPLPRRVMLKCPECKVKFYRVEDDDSVREAT